MTVDLEKELLEKHTDPEIIAFLYKVMGGVVKNYNNGLTANSANYLWGSFADVVMVRSILGEMKQRNDAKEALKQNMIQ